MRPRDPAALLRIAELRRKIGILSRGGEYDDALRLLIRHVGSDLGADLHADAVRRAHQAAALAEQLGDAARSAEAFLVLGVSLVATGDHGAALQAARLAAHRAGAMAVVPRRRMLAYARLVAGLAEASAGRPASARALLISGYREAVPLARPELTAALLTALGGVELMDGAADAAASCYWIARDLYQLAGNPVGAARAAAMPLVGFAVAERWAEIAALAPAIAADAEAHGLAEVAARVRGALADAHRALGAPEAIASAQAASDAARAMPAGPRQVALAVAARLRLAGHATDALDQVRHLEAAIDLASAADDVAQLVEIAVELVEGVAAERLLREALDALRVLAGPLRRLGARDVADLALAAAMELESGA
jgi:hypothetical protein